MSSAFSPEIEWLSKDGVAPRTEGQFVTLDLLQARVAVSF